MEKIDRIPNCMDDPFQAIHRMVDKINDLVDAVNELIGNDNRCLHSGHITDGQRMKCDYCGEWVQMKAPDPRPECERIIPKVYLDGTLVKFCGTNGEWLKDGDKWRHMVIYQEKPAECEDCRTLRMRRASMDEKDECKHEWAEQGNECLRCGKPWSEIKKPAKKECLCGGIAGPNHTCHYGKKDELAEKLQQVDTLLVDYYGGLAKEARKWAYETIVKWRDDNYLNKRKVDELLERLWEGQ